MLSAPGEPPENAPAALAIESRRYSMNVDLWNIDL